MKNTVKALIAIVMTVMLLWCITAVSEEDTLQLPKDLKIVKQYAFYGGTSIDKVVVPEGVTEIHSKAFAYSSIM